MSFASTLIKGIKSQSNDTHHIFVLLLTISFGMWSTKE